MSDVLHEAAAKKYTIHPDGRVEPGVGGVMHGPYRKTDNHPYDVADGNSKAIREAFHADRIGADHANDLQQGAAETVRLMNPEYAAHAREYGPAKIGGLAIGVEYVDEASQTIEVHTES